MATTSNLESLVKREDETNVEHGSGENSVIGLDVGGCIFYTHKSTLTTASPYFNARFGGRFHAGPSRHDSAHGCEVYFIDADPALFDHLLNFLRRGVPTWPEQLKQDDPILYRRLLKEAEYFGIDSMIEALQKNPPFCPNSEGKGVMYWLGTGKGREEYRNPWRIGSVTFGGSCTAAADREFEENDDDEWGGREAKLDSLMSRQNFVQYRPLCQKEHYFEGVTIDELLAMTFDRFYECHCRLLWCDHSQEGLDLVITLEQDIFVRPSHFSLRYSECQGMSHFYFQASVDGHVWNTLYEARSSRHIAPSDEKKEFMDYLFKKRCIGTASAKEKQAVATSIVEEELRHTYEVNSPNNVYFKHFRFLGVGDDDEMHFGCMHGVGFEVYGDVKEGGEKLS